MELDIYQPIGELDPDQTYKQVFMITRVTHHSKMNTAQNKPFAQIKIEDVTGSIEGKIWNYDPNNSFIKVGSYITADISTQTFNEELTFCCSMNQVSPAKSPDNLYDYIPGIPKEQLEYYIADVVDAIDQMDDSDYRDIVGSAVQRLSLLQSLQDNAYDIKGALSFRGGLLVHVAHSLRFAMTALEQIDELNINANKSLIIAGCILRNIGWSTILTFKGDIIQPLDAYHLIGINRASGRYIDHLFIHAESDIGIVIPEYKKQALENMCFPEDQIKTLEGRLVAQSNNMTDLLHYSAFSLKQKTTIEGWKNGFFIMDR